MSTATVPPADVPTDPPERLRSDRVVYDVKDVTLRFGGVTSLNNVSLQMLQGEVLAVIGPNGAGKTSLFNSLTGVYTPQEGTIDLAAREGDTATTVLGRKTHEINHMGVARTFQNIRLFPALTALENVKVGVETRQKAGAISAMLGLPRQRREERESTARAYELLRFVGLQQRANDLAGSLAYGEQRRLEIARALGTDPGVILLDEPAAGTNASEKRELASLILHINRELGISVLLIEHDMKLVMSIADRLIVLNFGQKIAEGTPEQIQKNPLVVAAYLGTSEDDAQEEMGHNPGVTSMGDLDPSLYLHEDDPDAAQEASEANEVFRPETGPTQEEDRS